MKSVSVKNKSISVLIITFILFKSIMLDIILKSFIRNIDDYEIRKKIIRDMIVINQFFRFVYNFIKKIKRINVKIQKFIKKKTSRMNYYFISFL